MARRSPHQSMSSEYSPPSAVSDFEPFSKEGLLHQVYRRRTSPLKRSSPIPNAGSLLSVAIMLFILLYVLFILSCAQQGGCNSESVLPKPSVHDGVIISSGDSKIANSLQESNSGLNSWRWNFKKVGSPNEGITVEYGVAGNRVKLSDAVRIDYPASPVEDLDYTAIELGEITDIPVTKNEIKLFIGVTTACTRQNREKRKAIRETWIQDALNLYDNVEIKFFLGQPSTIDADEYQLLEEEVREYGDIYFVRGKDSYSTLCSKTLGMLKYVLSSPERYTHMLKTDDDVYVRVHRLLLTLLNDAEEPQMTGVYKGCLADPNGFNVSRDPESKWYFDYDQLDERTAAAINGTFYLAGWGYILSRDLMLHAMKKMESWDRHLAPAPLWHQKLRMLEDVMIGALVGDAVETVDSDARFKAPWHGCDSYTAAIHLDVDAPRLVRGLYAQEVNGLWEKKTVTCSSGRFAPGDYNEWLTWRNSRSKADHRI